MQIKHIFQAKIHPIPVIILIFLIVKKMAVRAKSLILITI